MTNSHRQRRYQHVMIPRSQSPAISTSQRSNRGFQIEAFWRSSSTSNDDDGSDEDVAGTEEEKKQEEDASISSSSNEPPFALTESSPEYDVQPTMKKSLNKDRDKSLLTLFNHIGNNFKPMAKKAVAKGYQSKDQLKKVLYASKACLYYTLFILYRSYRGFIVLLPATFRQVYIKMEAAMMSGLSLEDNVISENENTTINNSINLKTKFTVSLLAGVVLVSYAFGAAVKMASKFVRTIAKTSSIQKSFEAAADEILVYEERIGRVGQINGDENVESSGLAP